MVSIKLLPVMSLSNKNQIIMYTGFKGSGRSDGTDNNFSCMSGLADTVRRSSPKPPKCTGRENNHFRGQTLLEERMIVEFPPVQQTVSSNPEPDRDKSILAAVTSPMQNMQSEAGHGI